MVRVGVLLVISGLLMLLSVSGCNDPQAADETGFEVVATNCIAIGIEIHIDDVFKQTVSAEQPYFFALPAGTYHIFARCNATLSMEEDNPLCWSRDISISEGNITRVLLDCEDAVECNDPVE